MQSGQSVGGRERVISCRDEIIATPEGLELITLGAGERQLSVFPPVVRLHADGQPVPGETTDGFSRHRIQWIHHPSRPLTVQATAEPLPVWADAYPYADPEAQAWRLSFTGSSAVVLDDVLLELAYSGDTAWLYLDGRLVAEESGTSRPGEFRCDDWMTGMRMRP